MTETLQAESDCAFTWLDILNPEEGELQAVAAQYGLPDALVHDCLDQAHLPKFEAKDGLNFVVLRVYAPPADNMADTIHKLTNKLTVFYTRDCLITVHRQPHPILNELKSMARAPEGACRTPAEVTLHLTRYALQSYVQPALDLNQQLDDYEMDIFLKKEVPDALQGLYFLKRHASVARQLLVLTREVLTSSTARRRR